MEISTITGKGQTTIPARIRNYLSLNRGDRIRYQIDGNGNVVLSASNGSVKDVLKIARPSKIRLSDEEIEKKMMSAISEKVQ